MSPARDREGPSPGPSARKLRAERGERRRRDAAGDEFGGAAGHGAPPPGSQDSPTSPKTPGGGWGWAASGARCRAEPSAHGGQDPSGQALRKTTGRWGDGRDAGRGGSLGTTGWAREGRSVSLPRAVCGGGPGRGAPAKRRPFAVAVAVAVPPSPSREGCAPGGPRRRSKRPRQYRGRLRRGLGAAGNGCIVACCARSPTRSAAEGHAPIRRRRS